MKKIIFAFLILILLICVSCETQSSDKVIEKIHEASRSIKASANYNAITESLFKQIRPRADIKNKDLTSEEVDKRVRKYISEKYTPVLIKNYEQIYSTLQEEKKDFSDCKAPAPIKPNEDILTSLCINVDTSFVEIKYLTNPYSQGWKPTSIFKFVKANGEYELSSIDIQLSGDQKAYVKGI